MCSNQQQSVPSSSTTRCAYVQCLKTESFCGSQCYSGTKVSSNLFVIITTLLHKLCGYQKQMVRNGKG